MNIRVKCPIISVRSASPVGSLSYQVKTRTRRQSLDVPFPSAGVLGWFFFVVVVILGYSLSRCGVVWCFSYFLVDLSWSPISHGNKPLVCHCHCLPVLFCVKFPSYFPPFDLSLSWRKDSGLFSMFLHLCLHEPLRMRGVHLCWVQRFRPSFRSTFMVILSCPYCLTIFFSHEVEHLPSL